MIVKIAMVVVYLLILVGIGVVASRRMKGLEDYFAAGKQLGFWSVAFSARATGESAWLLIGLTGMGAAVGAKAFWVVVGEVVGVTASWLLMSRRFKRLTDEYDSITIPDYLASRFRDESHKLRVVAAGALVIFVTIYVSAQIDATGKAFETFLGWDYFVGVGIGFVVVLAYIGAGGFLAVAWSDVFQGVLMFAGLVLLPIVGLVHLGGFGAMFDTLREIDPALLALSGTETPNLMTYLSIVALALVGIGFLGSPQIFVRFIALKNESEINRGAAVAFVWTVMADSGAVLTGMIGRAMLTEPGQNVEAVLGVAGESVLPMTVEALFPLFIVGIYVAIVLSAIMSTVDSLLVLAGSAAVRDVYQKVLHPEIPGSKLMSKSRQVTIGLAVAALLISVGVALVSPDRTVYWFVIFGWSGISATFCPVMILSLFWKGLTARGALFAMVTGFLCVPLFKFGAPLLPGVGPYFAELAELPPAFLISMTVALVVSKFDPAGQARLADIKLP